jgi:hypothetical protein
MRRSLSAGVYVKALLKFVFVTAGLVLLLIAVVVLFVMLRLDDAVQAATERAIEYAYETEVSIDGVDVSLGDGTMTIDGLTVYNPDPFPEGPALRFETIVVSFEVGTLFSNTPTINEMVLYDTTVSARWDPGRGTNLERLVQNAERVAGETSPGAPWAARKGFLIKELRSERATVLLTTNLIGGAEVPLDITPFIFKDVSRENSVELGSMIGILVRSLIKEGLSLKGMFVPMLEKLRDMLDGKEVESDPPPAEVEVDEPAASVRGRALRNGLQLDWICGAAV